MALEQFSRYVSSKQVKDVNVKRTFWEQEINHIQVMEFKMYFLPAVKN